MPHVVIMLGAETSEGKLSFNAVFDTFGLCRAIERGSHRWQQLRQQRLASLAPRWAQHGGAAPSARLVRTALEGNAWQADHIVPVFRGGGLCSLDNLRTLCTMCHLVRFQRLLGRRPSRKRAGADDNCLTADAGGDEAAGEGEGGGAADEGAAAARRATPTAKGRAAKEGLRLSSGSAFYSQEVWPQVMLPEVYNEGCLAQATSCCWTQVLMTARAKNESQRPGLVRARGRERQKFVFHCDCSSDLGASVCAPVV